jgi:acyl-coenzyme A thioesterase PaaI-like protein
VLAAAVDMVGSLFAREIAGADAIFTTDLSVRAPALAAPTRLVAHGEILHAGRSTVTSEVRLESDAAPFAYGQTSFRRVPRPGPAPTPEELARLVLPEVIECVPLERPLAREAGIVVADASRGCVALPLRDALRTPGGVMQGALVALLVEEAALALAEHADAGPHVVTELDVRYLAAGREGPIRSSADWVNGREGAMIRIALRDAGHEPAARDQNLADARSDRSDRQPSRDRSAIPISARSPSADDPPPTPPPASRASAPDPPARARSAPACARGRAGRACRARRRAAGTGRS